MGNISVSFNLVLPVAAVLALLTLGTGCASNRVPAPTTPTGALTPIPASSPAGTTTPYPYAINIASKSLTGNYLVDGRGITIYYTVSDLPGYSNLPDETLSSWPVFYVPVVTVAASLNVADFGTFTRDNGVRQTTYKGYPLYYFFQDKTPGDTLGNKLGGVWFVVNPDSFPSLS